MDRQPIYHKKQSGYRVVSSHNGKWQVQALTGKGTRERDPWQPMARPTNLQNAKRQLIFHGGSED
jgi:hypothetical protein